MRGKIGPGHAGRIAFRQIIDRFKPGPPCRIGGPGAVLHRGIERIEEFPRLGAAGGELRRSAIEKTLVHLLSQRSGGPEADIS